MGRIDNEDIVLVDLIETQQILGRSRATVFRLAERGILNRVAVAGTCTMYYTLDSIEQVKEKYKHNQRIRGKGKKEKVYSPYG